MQYKYATMSDAEGMIVYLGKLYKSRDLTISKKDCVPSLEDERNWLKTKDNISGCVILAIQDRQIVGMLDAQILRPDELRMNCEFGMSVLSEFRGKGIGSGLLTELHRWVAGKDVSRIELNVFGNNIPGIKLYEKFGFKVDGRRER